MSKAITGAVLLGAAAIGATVLTGGFSLPGILSLTTTEVDLLGAVAVAGLSMEAGAIAGALTSNRGMNITTRQAAAYRQVIYGEQRVGGVTIYQSTTGAKHDQYNFVIVLSGHEIDSILTMHLDGRQVYFNTGVGTTTRNGVTFGGSADGVTRTGPGGAQYNFGGLVYAEACYGDQLPLPNTQPGGGFNTGLQANDPVWGPSAQGIPYVAGCAYVYVKLVYNPDVFPSLPEMRFTVRGKNDIWDPRTGTRGYTNNWALVLADVFTDTQFGLSTATRQAVVNQAQLIVAANVCDEDVPLASGGTEKRYSCNHHYDSSTAPGTAIAAMMPAAAGRFTRAGGEWYLWPAYWQGPSFNFNESHLAAEFSWNPNRDRRDLINRVTGTYTAANYPYNATDANGSNVYDTNGFDSTGAIQNNFGLAFQSTSFPYYAADALHGYPADEYLLEDGGDLLSRDVALPCVLSISQAQRVAKIILMKNRMQGSGSFVMFPVAFRMQQLDVMQFSMAAMGWTEKTLEIGSVSLGLAAGRNGVPTPAVKVPVAETAASVYAWSASEELSIYAVPLAPQPSYIAAPPTNLEVTSSAATAVIGLDGVTTPRALVSWDEPLDSLAIQIEIAVQGPVVTGSAVPDWHTVSTVGIQNTSVLIGGLIAGQVYNFRIRSLRAAGGGSAWVEVDGVTISLVLSQLSQTGVGLGSMIAEAYGPGAAAIDFSPFTALIGNLSLPILPGGQVLVTQSSTNGTPANILPTQLYYGYYIDPNFLGGDVAPIVTQDPADFRGKQGYFLIDSVVTPASAGGGGSGSGGGGGGTGMRYAPSASHDVGTRNTATPDAAYDGNSSSAATVSSTSRTTAVGAVQSDCTRRMVQVQTTGDIIYQGFPSASSSLDAVLTVSLAVTGSVANAQVAATYGGNTYQVAGPFSAPVALASYTMSIPAGTIFSDVSVEASIVCNLDDGSGETELGNLLLYEIYIQA